MFSIFGIAGKAYFVKASSVLLKISILNVLPVLFLPTLSSHLRDTRVSQWKRGDTKAIEVIVMCCLKSPCDCNRLLYFSCIILHYPHCILYSGSHTPWLSSKKLLTFCTFNIIGSYFVRNLSYSSTGKNLYNFVGYIIQMAIDIGENIWMQPKSFRSPSEQGIKKGHLDSCLPNNN